MKSILISIKPEWSAKILNGDKTIEIRKTKPNCELPAKVYIYCTKAKSRNAFCTTRERISCLNKTNGKVVAEFILNKVKEKKFNYIFENPETDEEELTYNFTIEETDNAGFKYSLEVDEFLESYGNGKTLYTWHIEDLVIYKEPKELRDFYKPLPEKDLDNGNYSRECAGEVTCMDFPEGSENCIDCEFGGAKPLTKPPQSWFYVEKRL